MVNRVKEVNVEGLTDDQLERISHKLGEKLAKICEDAVNEANDILKIYGLQTKLQFSNPEKIQTTTDKTSN